MTSGMLQQYVQTLSDKKRSVTNAVHNTYHLSWGPFVGFDNYILATQPSGRRASLDTWLRLSILRWVSFHELVTRAVFRTGRASYSLDIADNHYKLFTTSNCLALRLSSCLLVNLQANDTLGEVDIKQ